jgi:hypothetical protein
MRFTISLYVGNVGMRTGLSNHYFIFDSKRDERRKRYIRKLQILDFLSRGALAHGIVRERILESQAHIKEFWQFDSLPPSSQEMSKITRKNISWYIKTHINVQNPIWNGSFLHGLAQSGKISYNKQGFPSMHSFVRKRLGYILNFCPFYGTRCDEGDDYGISWSESPSLMLKHDVSSYSFMAGVFAMGQELGKEGQIYAKYSTKCKPMFQQWSIPIEFESNDGYHCFISPLWPCLLQEWMPPVLRTWNRIPKAANASMYSGILWKVYRKGDFSVAAIPYLATRQTYSKKYSSDERTLTKNMHKMWVDYGLIGLDNRIKNLIRPANDV